MFNTQSSNHQVLALVLRVTNSPDVVLLVRMRLAAHPPSLVKALGVKHYSVRLACVRHAASVRPEPGSNSP